MFFVAVRPYENIHFLLSSPLLLTSFQPPWCLHFSPTPTKDVALKTQEALPVCLATGDVYGFCAKNWLPGALGGRGIRQKRDALGPNSDFQFQRAKLFLLFQFRPTSLGYLTSSSVSFLCFCPAWIKEPLNVAGPIAQEREDPAGHSGTWPSPWEHPPANGPSVTTRLLLRRKTRWPFWSWETVFLSIILESGNDSFFFLFFTYQRKLYGERILFRFLRTFSELPISLFQDMTDSLSPSRPRPPPPYICLDAQVQIPAPYSWLINMPDSSLLPCGRICYLGQKKKPQLL